MARTNNPDFKAVVVGTVDRLIEKNILDGARKQEVVLMVTDGLLPTYHQQGDFTVALLSQFAVRGLKAQPGTTMAVGVSKRNPTDPKMPLRGRSLALSRAVREFIVKVLLKTEEAVELKSTKPSTSAGVATKSSDLRA